MTIEMKVKFCRLLASNAELQDLLIREVKDFKGKELSERDKLIYIVEVIRPFIKEEISSISIKEDWLHLASVAIRWTRAHC